MEQLLIKYLVPLVNSTFSGFVKHLSEKLKVDESLISEAISSYTPNSIIPSTFKDLQAEIQSSLDQSINRESLSPFPLVGSYIISMGKYNSDIFLIWGNDTRNITDLLKDLGGTWKPMFAGKIYRVWMFYNIDRFDDVKKEIENRTGANIRIDNRYYNPEQKSRSPFESMYRNKSYIPLTEGVIKPSDIKKSAAKDTPSPPPSSSENLAQLQPGDSARVTVLKKATIPSKKEEISEKKNNIENIKLGKVVGCKNGTYYAIDHGFVFKNIGTNPKKIVPFCIGHKKDRNDENVDKISQEDIEKLNKLKIKYDQDAVETFEEEKDYLSSGEEEREEEESEDEYSDEDEDCSEGESDGEEI